MMNYDMHIHIIYIYILGTISATKKTIPELSTVFNNTDALDASDANTEHETSFKEECKLYISLPAKC